MAITVHFFPGKRRRNQFMVVTDSYAYDDQIDARMGDQILVIVEGQNVERLGRGRRGFLTACADGV